MSLDAEEHEQEIIALQKQVLQLSEERSNLWDKIAPFRRREHALEDRRKNLGSYFFVYFIFVMLPSLVVGAFLFYGIIIDSSFTGPILGVFLILITPLIAIWYLISDCSKKITNCKQQGKPLLEQITTKDEVIDASKKRIHALESLINEKKKELFERRQTERGLLKFVDRLGRERWGSPEQIKHWKIVDMDLANNFGRLKAREFEKLIRALFERMGYDARLTSFVSDYGADVIARKNEETIVVEVKKFQDQVVGRPEVQKLLGSMFKYSANKAIFITTSEFTHQARELERTAPLELWNRTKLHTMIEKYFLDEN